MVTANDTLSFCLPVHFIVQKKNLNLNQLFLFLIKSFFPLSRWYTQGHDINPKQKWATRSKCAISSARHLMCLFSVDLWSRLTSRIFCFTYHLQCSSEQALYETASKKSFSKAWPGFFFLLAQIQSIKTSIDERNSSETKLR